MLKLHNDTINKRKTNLKVVLQRWTNKSVQLLTLWKANRFIILSGSFVIISVCRKMTSQKSHWFVLSIVLVFASQSVVGFEDVVIQIFSKKLINVVSDKFISFSIDPKELLEICDGSRFVIFSSKKLFKRIFRYLTKKRTYLLAIRDNM